MYLQQLVQVVPHVAVHECGVQHLEVRVVDVLEDQAGGFGLRVAHNVQQLDDVGTPTQVLQDLDLALYLRARDLSCAYAGCGQLQTCCVLLVWLTFFFFTGLRIFMMQVWLLTTFTPSKTSLYFPLPTLRTTS